MQTRKTAAALALPALLLAGARWPTYRPTCCPPKIPRPLKRLPTAAPQSLTVYASASLAPAARAYADAQGVALTVTDDSGAADLLLVDHASGGSLLDVTSDTLLAAAAARADITDNANTLPLGRSLYGYWASKDALTALLGDDPVTALQGATWDEWSDFVETLSAWLAAPKAAVVTLSGQDYTLPETKPDAVKATGVFCPACRPRRRVQRRHLGCRRHLHCRRPDRPAER